MNIKRLLSLAGTTLIGLSFVWLWLWSASDPRAMVAHAAGSWYVTPGGNDSNLCTDPGAPCATINGAIGKASGGDTIFTALGTYTGTGDEVVLVDKDITLSGGWDAAFVSQGDTTTINGEDIRRGLVVNYSESANVDHFTIQNGYSGDGNGGGVYNNGTLTLTNSTISDNFAHTDVYNWYGGGGIYNIGTLTLINCIVRNNVASMNGGGIYGTNGSSTVIMDSQVYANTTDYGGRSGGGINVESDSRLSISRSWVVGNAALSNEGGGISIWHDLSTHIENSIIAGNYTGGSGGGLWVEQGGPHHIINSHIVGNEADEDGAAIALYYSQIEITNTLITSNTGDTGIDSQWGADAVFLLSYCDTYGNSPDGTVNVTITRTSCLGALPEVGIDPLMAGGALPSGVGPDYASEWLSYDYQLLAGSPAIDEGTSIGAPVTDIDGWTRDAKPDIGAYEYLNLKYIYLPVVLR